MNKSNVKKRKPKLVNKKKVKPKKQHEHWYFITVRGVTDYAHFWVRWPTSIHCLVKSLMFGLWYLCRNKTPKEFEDYYSAYHGVKKKPYE